jgi:hypothetical protein
MAQLTHLQYEMIERAVVDGTRLAVRRRGRREYIVIPLRLRVVDGRELIETRNPTTGHDMTLFLDDLESIEVVR